MRIQYPTKPGGGLLEYKAPGNPGIPFPPAFAALERGENAQPALARTSLAPSNPLNPLLTTCRVVTSALAFF
jgi:hypothetical protein